MATASDATERETIMLIAQQRALQGRQATARTYFGDGAWDKRASRNLGYDFIAIGRRVDHPVIFEDLRDQVAVLERLGV